jgi:hypothetical protein
MMNDVFAFRVSRREKIAWKKMARQVGEDLGEFVHEAVRQRVQAMQAQNVSPWDDLPGSVSTDAPPGTNANVREAMRAIRCKYR